MPSYSNAGANFVASNLPRLQLDRVVREITEVSTLPQVAMQTIELCNNPETGAADLRDLIESDPALSSRVLRCVNAASNGLVRRITCIQQAVSYLGFKQVRNLAVTASVSSIFCDGDRIGSYSRSGLWKHLVWTGVAARFIASRCNIQEFEDVFLAGLLHDLGIILEDQYCHKHFVAVINSLSDQDTLPHLEKRIMGFDHPTLGKRIAEKWKFPTQITSAIRFHHMPDKYRGDDAGTVASVVLANYLCFAKGVSSVGGGKLECSPYVLETLGVGRQDLIVIAEDLNAELKQYDHLLEVLAR